ncbi:MAG: flagellar basal body-associated FliL family protein [Alphaproteobacteria bacterium]|nr:flagellar basal body-associated FliL family protein [Alphaproteobacteria bacterium]
MMDFIRKNRLSVFIASYTVLFALLAVCGALLAKERVENQRLQAGFGTGQRGLVTDMAYCDLPRMTVSMHNPSSASAPYLRADLSLEVSRADEAIIEGYQPRIMEKLNILLSNVDMAEIQRDHALPQLRAAMLKAVNSSGIPVPVHDLLFRELVIM